MRTTFEFFYKSFDTLLFCQSIGILNYQNDDIWGHTRYQKNIFLNTPKDIYKLYLLPKGKKQKNLKKSKILKCLHNSFCINRKYFTRRCFTG